VSYRDPGPAAAASRSGAVPVPVPVRRLFSPAHTTCGYDRDASGAAKAAAMCPGARPNKQIARSCLDAWLAGGSRPPIRFHVPPNGLGSRPNQILREANGRDAPPLPVLRLRTRESCDRRPVLCASLFAAEIWYSARPDAIMIHV
jgi:hypothetical protein